jgi:deoxyribodipyrimidine photo-lyase
MTTFNDARLRKLNAHPPRTAGQYVLYWMQMYRRLSHNHALDYALAMARHFKKPLVIYEGLKRNYPWANARLHTVFLEGMRENARRAKEIGVTYWPFVETPEQHGHGILKDLAEDATMIVTDDYPTYITPGHNRAIGQLEVAAHAIDSNGCIPLARLGPSVGAAAHLRPRMHKLFAEAWENRASAEPDFSGLSKAKSEPPFELWKAPKDLPAFVKLLGVDPSVPAIANEPGGPTAGRERLAKFVQQKLGDYAEHRSEPGSPTDNAASGLSTYLRFGHLAIDEVIEATLNAEGEWTAEEINPKTRNKDDFFCRNANVNSFLDEAITWRELGYHWMACRVRDSSGQSRHSWWTGGSPPAFNFESMDFSPLQRGTLETVLPPWAQATLNAHANDRREYVYTREQFENADTHDELWNAAQLELIHTGRIHNYLRMLWGKKVLEWSASPEEAYRVLEHLNNKYALDGRDPNSYTGILWCFGLFDRPWPGDRDVFGSVRFMSSDNTAKKFRLAPYFQYVRSLTAKSEK